MPSILTSKGRVTIPKTVRDHLGLRAGGVIEFELGKDGEATISAATKPGRSNFAQLRGSAGSGPSTDEIMKLMRG